MPPQGWRGDAQTTCPWRSWCSGQATRDRARPAYNPARLRAL